MAAPADPREADWYNLALATRAPTDVEHEMELQPMESISPYWMLSSIRWEEDGPHQNLYSQVTVASGSVLINYAFLDLVLSEFLTQIPLYKTGEIIVVDWARRILLASNSTRANSSTNDLEVVSR